MTTHRVIHTASSSGRSIEPTEYVVSYEPDFVVRRRARFSECDLAGVVNAARYSEYVIAATQLHLEYAFDGALVALKQESAVRLPVRALQVDLRRSLVPEQRFDMVVVVTEVGATSFTHVVAGRDLDGNVCFEGRVVYASASRQPPFVRAPLPSAIQTVLEREKEKSR